MTVILNFEDTDDFYLRLSNALKSGNQIEILTNFKTEKDAPDRLKSALGSSKFNSELIGLLGSISPFEAASRKVK